MMDLRAWSYDMVFDQARRQVSCSESTPQYFISLLASEKCIVLTHRLIDVRRERRPKRCQVSVSVPLVQVSKAFQPNSATRAGHRGSCRRSVRLRLIPKDLMDACRLAVIESRAKHMRGIAEQESFGGRELVSINLAGGPYLYEPQRLPFGCLDDQSDSVS